MIRGLAGVIIWTDDLGRMADFYRDTLGLKPHSERPSFVSFKWGDVRLGIGSHSGVKGASSDPYRVMVNLDVEDIHAAHERLSQARVWSSRVRRSGSTGAGGCVPSPTPTGTFSSCWSSRRAAR